MVSEYELAKTFFPGSRKEIFIESIKLLETRAGEKRLQIGMTMPLADQKLVGMPTWLGDSYDIIAKENSLLQSDKWGHDLKEMTLTVFPTDDSPKASHIAIAPLLSNFSLRRDPQSEEDEELSGVNLHFVAYINATMDLWRYFYGVHRKTIYLKFETTQQELFAKQPEDTQMKLVSADDDDYEAARQDATSKARDAEFTRA